MSQGFVYLSLFSSRPGEASPETISLCSWWRRWWQPGPITGSNCWGEFYWWRGENWQYNFASTSWRRREGTVYFKHTKNLMHWNVFIICPKHGLMSYIPSLICIFHQLLPWNVCVVCLTLKMLYWKFFFYFSFFLFLCVCLCLFVYLLLVREKFTCPEMKVVSLSHVWFLVLST